MVERLLHPLALIATVLYRIGRRLDQNYTVLRILRLPCIALAVHTPLDYHTAAFVHIHILDSHIAPVVGRNCTAKIFSIFEAPLSRQSTQLMSTPIERGGTVTVSS